MELTDIVKDEVKWRKMAVYIGARGEDVDDMIQNMYLKLAEIKKKEGNLNRLVNIRGPKIINTLYIFKILQSEIVNVQRRDEKQVQSMRFFNPIEHPDNAELAYQDLMDKVKSAINDMHDYDQRILELYFVYGYSLRSLSKCTGISVASIFNTIDNAKKIIKIKVNGKYKNYIQEKAESETIQRVGG